MVGMKGDSVGILEVDAVTVDPIFVDTTSKKSVRFSAWISV